MEKIDMANLTKEQEIAIMNNIIQRHYGKETDIGKEFTDIIAVVAHRQHFTDGYTTRNDEVVKMVECRIAELKTVERHYVDFRITELQDLLTKLKEDKK